MAEGIHKRIQPDLVAEIEQYPGGSFSEKMVKWKNDVNTSLDFDFESLDNLIEDKLNKLVINPQTGEARIE